MKWNWRWAAAGAAITRHPCRRRRARLLPPRPGEGARHPRLVDGRVRPDRGAADDGPDPDRDDQPGHAQARGADPRRLADLWLRRAPAAVPAEQAGAALPRGVDVPRAAPARVPARRRLRARVHREQPGDPLRRAGGDGANELALPLGPLRGGVAGGRERGRLHGVPEQAAQGPGRLQRRAVDAGARRRGRRARRAHREAALAADRSARARPRRSSRTAACTWATGAATSTRSTRRPAAGRVALPHRRPGEGRVDALRPAALRRLVRPLPLRAPRRNGKADLARLVARTASAGGARSTRRRPPPTAGSTSGRPTARSTPTARRAGRCAGRSRRTATSTARRRSGTG